MCGKHVEGQPIYLALRGSHRMLWGRRAICTQAIHMQARDKKVKSTKLEGKCIKKEEGGELNIATP